MNRLVCTTLSKRQDLLNIFGVVCEAFFFHTRFAVCQCSRWFPNRLDEIPEILCTHPKVSPFFHDRVRRGVGLFLISRHKLIYITLTLCKHACKVDCDVKSGIDPLSFWLSRGQQKMLGFSQVLKPIKWQDLLEDGKNSRNSFRGGENIHFSAKILGGLGAI